MYRIQMAWLISVVILLTCVSSAFSETVSEEARRYMIRGETAVEMAKTAEDYEQAIKEFQEAVRIAPDWAAPYYNLGLVQEKAGKLKEAVISLDRYLQLSPNAPDNTEVREFIYKLEYKAEQVITREDALDIYGSLPDTKWELSGDTSAVYKSWIKGFRREGNRIAITYFCDIQKQNNYCTEYAEMDGKTNILKFQLYFGNFYWPCSGVGRCDGAMGVLGQYVFEIVSRQKIVGNAVESFPKMQNVDAQVYKRRFEYIRK